MTLSSISEAVAGSAVSPFVMSPARPGLWRALAQACSNALAQWRGTSVLALGDSFGSRSEPGKSAQVVQRLRKLNPALRVESLCASGLDLLDAGVAAGTYPRGSFDAALVFLGRAQIAHLDENDNFADAADAALRAISGVARRAFVVTAFDEGATRPRGSMARDLGATRRIRYLERTLRHLCELHDVEWVPLAVEEGSIAAAPQAACNFSVDGFSSATDQHEMWTARMLQQPALARLVFH